MYRRWLNGGALLRGALQYGVLKACDTHILVRRERTM